MMRRALIAEALGTALLVATVIGSGIMAERLAGGNAALALLANAIATGAVLYGLILVFAPISGAHFNPAVTLMFWRQRQLPGRRAVAYASVQFMGGAMGAVLAHLMFSLPVVTWATTARSGPALWLSEGVATLGLLLLIAGLAARGAERVAPAVALYITGAYWFTASTAFANPAVTLARTLSDTFAGIAPAHAPAFIAVQLAVAFLSAPLLILLFKPADRSSN